MVEDERTVEQPSFAAPSGEEDAVSVETAGTRREAGRVRRRIAQGSRWAKAQRSRGEGALRAGRQRSSLIDAGFEIQELDAHVGGGILAGAIAFRMFLFLVPFVYVVFMVFGLAAKTANEDPGQLAKTIGITGVLASAVVNTSDLSAWSQLLLVSGATVALVLTDNSLIKALYVVHWLVWRTSQTKSRGFVPILAVIGIGLGLTGFIIFANDVRRAASGVAGVLLAILVVTAVSFAVWWWISWKLPHAQVPASALVPGALLMALGVEVLHALTTYWIGHLVARKANTYGAVGIALAVLFWVYVLGRIIVGSAGLNATLWHRRQGLQSASGSAEPPP
jgi:uncharacterized BrkB/YihY/UPF0761 family membrane protein